MSDAPQKKEYILGVDPGGHGAFVLLHTKFNRRLIYKNDILMMPGRKLKDGYNVDEMCNWLKEMSEKYTIYTYMEHNHALGNVGANSSYIFGWYSGIAYGLCLAYTESINMVSPKVWQNAIRDSSDVVLDSNGKVDTKPTALRMAGRIFPGVSFIPPKYRTPHDGVVDAALIAYYGLMIHTGAIQPAAQKKKRRSKKNGA